MKTAPHFMTMAAVLVLGTSVASAQGIKTDDHGQAGSTAEQKKAPQDLRGPDGFTPQESSPANGSINVRSTRVRARPRVPRSFQPNSAPRSLAFSTSTRSSLPGSIRRGISASRSLKT